MSSLYGDFRQDSATGALTTSQQRRLPRTAAIRACDLASGLYAPGGALDSQTTETQHIDALVGSRDAYDSEPSSEVDELELRDAPPPSLHVERASREASLYREEWLACYDRMVQLEQVLVGRGEELPTYRVASQLEARSDPPLAREWCTRVPEQPVMCCPRTPSPPFMITHDASPSERGRATSGELSREASPTRVRRGSTPESRRGTDKSRQLYALLKGASMAERKLIAEVFSCMDVFSDDEDNDWNGL
ncbi:hypothetical protein FA95DRAFT_1680881 [Auriscalpium vulgare]|uniref:Uncharacterized protein n=1 Tax=Auriscalpium vulgare TaxID=40419 RepID=A0ACB8RMV5_9AGAM|nr:hypothetical protein FA95DRAFT_1680881 [Auriscalpium vulgare]